LPCALRVSVRLSSVCAQRALFRGPKPNADNQRAVSPLCVPGRGGAEITAKDVRAAKAAREREARRETAREDSSARARHRAKQAAARFEKQKAATGMVVRPHKKTVLRRGGEAAQLLREKARRFGKREKQGGARRR
jgi:hypothetical protein